LQLRELVEDCVLLLDSRLRAKKVSLLLSGGEGVLVLAPDNSLRQVVLNVLSNALDASVVGGRITIRLLRIGQWSAIAIRDEGLGLGAVEEDRIFEAFYSTKQASDGAGLGLGMAVSRGLMRSMGGEIRIRDRRRGSGVLCVLFLPSMMPGDRRLGP
jgi:signal transduction histidine kinase